MNQLNMLFCWIVFGCAVAGCARNGSVCTHPDESVLDTSRLESFKDARQVVRVTTPDWTGCKATVEGFEKIDGTWRRTFGPVPAVIGRNGLARDKREGDGKSPAGIFTFGTFFGSASKLSGVKFPFRQTTANDFWVDDPASLLYNTWQTGPAKGRWKSAETLRRPDGLYKYAAVINYNTDRIAGRGSAIFLHVWRSADHPTAGCTALAEANLVRLLAWLDPAKRPILIQEPRCQNPSDLKVTNLRIFTIAGSTSR